MNSVDGLRTHNARRGTPCARASAPPVHPRLGTWHMETQEGPHTARGSTEASPHAGKHMQLAHTNVGTT
ncbi:hypothetical protein IscW_ISCW015539 [Ixodes scapularis]|uniref:Uncharacterized protein n=2 Tax=Ixodes TaxID=6944 RepID=B7QN65_IXOSC|nr:hypothetical protein IscW_ISCW015539 [Ixodes scapularis]|eukprot:XP_002400745.1 hypothetical protein IscW_ISCW015539 [Ixodes scapularis]